MKLLTCMLTKNQCYLSGRKIWPRGIMVHSTGANNPYLRRYVQPADNDPNKDELLKQLGVNKNQNAWNRYDLNVCVHGFIGKLADGSIGAVQTLPWDHRGWHAGSGTSGKSANDTHISFEICEDNLADRAYFNEVYKTAVEFTAMLCKEYGFNPLGDGVIICHSEGYRRGIASLHADVEHWFPKCGKSMDDFRNDVNKLVKELNGDNMKYYKYYDDIPVYYRSAVDKAIQKDALRGIDTDITDRVIYNVSEDICRTLTILDRMGNL